MDNMTGKDFIIFILKNNLLDEPIFKDGRFMGFVSPEDAAVKLHVGPAAIDAMISLGHLDCLVLKDTRQIPVYELKQVRKE